MQGFKVSAEPSGKVLAASPSHALAARFAVMAKMPVGPAVGFDRLPARWLFAWTYNALIPHAELMRSIERFAMKVLPRVAHLDDR